MWHDVDRGLTVCDVYKMTHKKIEQAMIRLFYAVLSMLYEQCVYVQYELLTNKPHEDLISN